MRIGKEQPPIKVPEPVPVERPVSDPAPSEQPAQVPVPAEEPV